METSPDLELGSVALKFGWGGGTWRMPLILGWLTCPVPSECGFSTLAVSCVFILQELT